MIFVGDLHGKWDEFYDKIERLEIEKDTVIQVGDFGKFPFNNPELRDLISKVNNTNIDLKIVRGNHDNPINWPQKIKNVRFMGEYAACTIEDKTVLFVGGGTSVDRIQRTKFVSYWDTENIRTIPYDLESSVKALGGIDIVVSHVPLMEVFSKCPNYSSKIIENYIKRDPSLETELEIEQEKLQTLYGMLQKYGLKHWVAGHMHESFSTKYNGIDFHFLDELEFKEII